MNSTRLEAFIHRLAIRYCTDAGKLNLTSRVVEVLKRLHRYEMRVDFMQQLGLWSASGGTDADKQRQLEAVQFWALQGDHYSRRLARYARTYARRSHRQYDYQQARSAKRLWEAIERNY